jgi:hypothetical protein
MVPRAWPAPYDFGMVNVRMTVADLASTRFAFSPLAEVGLSLYLLSGGEVRGLHQGWYQDVRPALARVDMELLCSVVPRRGLLADFLFLGATDASTRIETQLGLLAEFPLEALAKELDAVWADTEIAPPAQALLAMGCKAPRYLADVMYDYWTAAVEPHWSSIRSALEDDVAFRAGELTRGGMATMVSGMHPSLYMRRLHRHRQDVQEPRRDPPGRHGHADGAVGLFLAGHRLVHDAGQRAEPPLSSARRRQAVEPG